MTNDELKEYLDNAICNWRKKKAEARRGREKLIASCYIDAFQSVRKSVFGELLLPEGWFDFSDFRGGNYEKSN